VKGEALKDESRTQEDDKESPKGDEADSDESKDTKLNDGETTEPNDETTDQNMKDEPQINESNDEKCADKVSSLDVCYEQKEADAEEDKHVEPMQLDDELNQDESGDAETNQGGMGWIS
jgi:hypothetical protein